MELPKGYLEKFAPHTTPRQETEYAWYLNASRKIIGQPYIVLHRRLAQAFEGCTLEFLLSHIKAWYHEAEKAKNPGLVFNARFKQFREYEIKKST